MSRKKNNKRSSGGFNPNYLTKMGARNLIANKSMSFSSISVLTACLLLIGISVVILLNIQTLVKDVEKQNVVVAFVKEGITDEQVQKVGTDLSSIPNVLAADFVSKEEGYEEQLKEFGVEKDLFDDVIENPLPHSYRISVSNLEEFSITLQQIEAVENVDSVRESQELVNQISVIQKSVTAICMIVVIVLAFVSMFIISNTIRITMVSRKIDIQVMKSVGATNTFICWPFMIEGIIIGFISGMISLGLTILFQEFEGESLSSLLELFGSTAISITDHLPLLIATYLLSGVLISSMGSVFSIRKYLKKEGSEANDI
ncbi:MAG: permease-like cell division protein FtsX [Clostridia bacterium]|nr:permease-like cell division protein FtsX [Clostridia bacterium]MBR2418296.1 permease-like cell division protein FtsX [Clostridia bacterium]